MVTPRLLNLALPALLVLLAPCFVAVPARGQGATPEDKRELIAVMDMQAVGASKVETEAITDRMREVMLKSGRFKVVDRSQMQALLNEQAFQQAGCTDQECAVKVGQMLGVRKIVAGKVIKFSDTAWQVSAMMVDVETAETLRADSVRHQGDVFSLLEGPLATLGARLVGGSAPVAVAVAVAPVVAALPAAPPPAPPGAPATIGPPLQRIVGTWSEGPPLEVGRSAHASVLLGQQVLVLGGLGQQNRPLDSVELLDLQHYAWQALAPMPGPRQDLAAAVYQGRVYAIGGAGADGVLSRVDVLDPVTHAWSPGPPLPSPRKGAVAAVLDGRLYVVGGMAADGSVTNQALLLDDAGSAWQPRAPLQDARAFATAQVVEGRLYVIGGRRQYAPLAIFGSPALLQSVEAYDPAANAWQKLPELPVPLSQPASVAVGRTLTVFGGYTGSAVFMSPQERTWSFTLGGKVWSEGGHLPPPRGGAADTALGTNASRAEFTALLLRDRVLLIGGKPSHLRQVNELR